MLKGDLQELCRKLSVSPVGTKTDLVKRILEAEKKTRARKALTHKGSESEDIKIWKRELKNYAGSIDFPRPSNFSWSSPRVLLCPPL
jgi:hypothetical protein